MSLAEDDYPGPLLAEDEEWTRFLADDEKDSPVDRLPAMADRDVILGRNIASVMSDDARQAVQILRMAIDDEINQQSVEMRDTRRPVKRGAQEDKDDADDDDDDDDEEESDEKADATTQDATLIGFMAPSDLNGALAEKKPVYPPVQGRYRAYLPLHAKPEPALDNADLVVVRHRSLKSAILQGGSSWKNVAKVWLGEVVGDSGGAKVNPFANKDHAREFALALHAAKVGGGPTLVKTTTPLYLHVGSEIRALARNPNGLGRSRKAQAPDAKFSGQALLDAQGDAAQVFQHEFQPDTWLPGFVMQELLKWPETAAEGDIRSAALSLCMAVVNLNAGFASANFGKLVRGSNLRLQSLVHGDVCTKNAMIIARSRSRAFSDARVIDYKLASFVPYNNQFIQANAQQLYQLMIRVSNERYPAGLGTVTLNESHRYGIRSQDGAELEVPDIMQFTTPGAGRVRGVKRWHMYIALVVERVVIDPLSWYLYACTYCGEGGKYGRIVNPELIIARSRAPEDDFVINLAREHRDSLLIPNRGRILAVRDFVQRAMQEDE